MSSIPSYFFHLTFELYPYPQPEPHPAQIGDNQSSTYLPPPPGTDIFRNFSALPKRCPKNSFGSSYQNVSRAGASGGSLSAVKDKDNLINHRPAPGLPLGATGGAQTQGGLSGVITRTKKSVGGNLRPLQAVTVSQDRRYTRISIESIDMVPGGGGR